MWETRDPDGRDVVLSWADWLHVLHRNPYIRVVVHYEHGRGRIVTAFPRRSIP